MMKQIRTALLSYGMSGEVFHGPLLEAHKGFSIEAVYHRNPPREKKHSRRVVTSLQAIYQDPNIDLIIVNTPDNTHYEYTRAALEAGKHVVTEKPFTINSKEADELISLARERRLILSVFQNRRWDGGFLTVQDILRKKMLGRVVEFELHYDRYRNYIQSGTWKETEELGTGILYNLGSHMLDQVIVLFGKPVFADARMGIQRTGGKVIDYYDIRLEYDGLNVIVKSSYLVREPGPMYRINGTEGSFVKYGIDPQEQALKEKQRPDSPDWGADPPEYWGKLNTTFNGENIERKVETMRGNYLGYYDNLYEAIANGAELAVKPAQSRDVIALIELCIKSSQERKALRVT